MSFALLLAGVRKLLTHSNMQIIWVRRIGDLVQWTDIWSIRMLSAAVSVAAQPDETRSNTLVVSANIFIFLFSHSHSNGPRDFCFSFLLGLFSGGLYQHTWVMAQSEALVSVGGAPGSTSGGNSGKESSHIYQHPSGHISTHRSTVIWGWFVVTVRITTLTAVLLALVFS